MELTQQETEVSVREYDLLEKEERLKERWRLLEEREDAQQKREVFLLDMEKSIHAFIDVFRVRVRYSLVSAMLILM